MPKLSVPKRENKNIEFKEKLSADIHLKEERKQQLASQMKYRLELGKGTAIYIIGVDDNGSSVGVSDIEFEETLNVLKVVAMENNASLSKVEKFAENGHLIARVIIKQNQTNGIKHHVVIGLGGHVHHGKSTLIGSLITGKPDINGSHWLFLNVLPHEIEKRLTADLHYTFLGFKDGKPLHFKNPLDKKEKSKLISLSEKVISFIDNVGHEAWLYSSIRGLVGQSIDYGLLTVAADDGVTHITKEHLGLLLASDLPMIICITKIDKMGRKRIEEVEVQIEELLKHVGRIPFVVKDENDVSVVINKMDTVVAVLKTSAVTLEGYELLNKLLLSLPSRKKDVDKPFLMFIDRVYNVGGVGIVVSGTIKQGKLKPGKELLLGPDESGNFKKVKATSIEMHYHQLNEADAGFVVGVAVRGAKDDDIERGMILCENDVEPKSVKIFEGEILVLNHPTRIATNYEPILHLNTVASTVKVELLDKNYLKSGESGKVRMTFKYHPQFVREGDKFVFREGKTKGIGTVTKIVQSALRE